MRPSSMRAHTLMTLMLSLLLLLSGRVHAQSAADTTDATDAKNEPAAATESARSHFRLGVDFYRERNFRAALIEFQRAYADSPHYKLLYNLGQASLELQEYASAIDFFSAYLREGGNELASDRRAEVEESIRYLESRIARLSIASNQSGAEIYVDDTLLGRTPQSEPIRVGAGRHKIVLTKEGFAQVERQLDVAAGDEREVRLDFIIAPAVERREPMSPTMALSPIDRDEDSSSVPIIIAGIATGVLAAGAVTMTIVTGIAQQDYQEQLLVETTRTKLDTLRDDAETKALVTDIVWGATLASAVVTTVLILTSDNERAASAASAGHTRRINLSVGLSGFEVTSRF